MKYGYARVSTSAQNLDVQLEKLKEAGCDEIYAEKQSGGKTHRKQLNRILEKIQPGDFLVLYDLSRLGRTGSKLMEILEDFNSRNINFIFLNMNCDTSTTMGRFFFTIMAAVYQMEREEIQKKVKDGIDYARSQGRHPGKPKKITPQLIQRAKELSRILPYSEAMKVLGVSQGTYYRALSY